MGERLLLRRRPGGLDELEGILLRLLRRLELHHRRQVAGRALGDGHLRADLRSELVEHPRAAGARRRRDGRLHLPHRPPVVPGGGSAHRRCDSRAHTGRSAHVPIRQSRRTPRAAAHRRNVRGGSCDRGWEDQVARPCRDTGWIRVPHQDAPGIPGRSRVRARLPGCRSRLIAPAHHAARRRRRGDGRGIGMVGRDRAAHPGRGPSVYRRIPGQQHPQSDLRLQRFRPPHRQ